MGCPAEHRDQLCDQLIVALDAAQARVDAAAPRLKARYIMQIIKLCRIVLMEARDRIEQRGDPKKWYPYLRKRTPDKYRQPRINRQKLRVQQALAHKAAREAGRNGWD